MIISQISTFHFLIRETLSSRTQGPHAPLLIHFPQVLVNKQGSSFLVTLNRPKALNALTLGMIRTLKHTYSQAESVSTSAVLLQGDPRSFCAGGDIVQIYHSGLAAKQGKDAGSTAIHRSFFAEEYNLNEKIGRLTPPHVALLTGFTMGGGVGLSVHGAFRVACENTVFAMPETAIGFFPDVGGSYFLSRLQSSSFSSSPSAPSALGVYLALTGARLKGGDVLHSGVATHFLASASFDKLREALAALPAPKSKEDAHSRVRSLLATLAPSSAAPTPSHPALTTHKEKVRAIFSLTTVEDMFAALTKEGNDAWALETLKLLSKVRHRNLLP